MSARNHCVILARYTSIVKETKESLIISDFSVACHPT